MSSEKKRFLDNCWYAAAWGYEVAEHGKLARMICEQPIAFFKTASGKFFALDDRCCHRAAPLSIGRVEGECVRCMYHGLVYDSSGQCVEIPGQEKIPSGTCVHSYPVVEAGHLLWIWMGDPELADPGKIHHFAPLDDEQRWRGLPRQHYLHYDANWLLIVDNLSDFSHIAFVHTNTLGGSESYAYSSQIENLERIDSGFRLERWHRNSNPPPFHRKVIPESEHALPVDRCNLVEMHIPGVFFMETLFKPVNGRAQPVREYRNCQYMTPETRNTTHFFWNYLHNFDLDNPEIAQSLRDSLLEGFLEDKVIIEAQQKLLESAVDFVPRFIAADQAFAHFRNVWEQALLEEASKRPLARTKLGDEGARKAKRIL